MLRRAPLPDELLSSWLLRTINAYGAAPHRFCKSAFPEFDIWNRDIDRFAPWELLETIDRLSQFKPGTSASMTVQKFARIVQPNDKRGRTLFLLSVGINSRHRKRHGLQYCPYCLDDDPSPYFRKKWRYAFYTRCESHLQPMRDSCPHCDAPVIPHRAPELDFVRCHACGESLLDGIEKTLVESNPLISEMSDAAESDVGFSGPRDFAGERRIQQPTCEFFHGLRSLASLWQESRRAQQLSAKPIGNFEEQRLTDRTQTLSIVNQMVREWPIGFVSFCETYSINQRHGVAAKIDCSWVNDGMALIDPGLQSDRRKSLNVIDKLVLYQRRSYKNRQLWKEKRAELLMKVCAAVEQKQLDGELPF
jgi:hypothetical protein